MTPDQQVSALSNGVKPGDQARAIQTLLPIAESGHRQAQAVLAVFYAHGDAAVRDHAKSVRWYQAAAEQGHPFAQYMVGAEYMEGKVLPRDLGKAKDWLRRAAEQNDARAQMLLGLTLFSGKLGEKNPAEATALLRRSAEQGVGDSMYVLGQKIAYGKPADTVEGYKWLALSGIYGVEGADVVTEIAGHLNVLAKTMTAEQLEEAQRRVRQWRPAFLLP